MNISARYELNKLVKRCFITSKEPLARLPVPLIMIKPVVTQRRKAKGGGGEREEFSLNSALSGFSVDYCDLPVEGA
jgi:hypothetical protein